MFGVFKAFAALLAAAGPPAGPSGFDRIVVFGDSLSDGGDLSLPNWTI